MPIHDSRLPSTDAPHIDASHTDARDLPHRAAQAAFPILPTPAGPAWTRRATAAGAAAAARALFAQVDPAAPATYAKVLCPPIHPVFPPALISPEGAVPLGVELAESVANGSPLFLQGAALGVGASTLAATYANEFNRAAHAHGDPRRVIYVPVMDETRTLRHFVDAIAVELGAPLTNPEIRFRSPNYLARRLLATAAQRRVVAIVIDPPHHLARAARGVVAGLLQVLNPAYHVPLHGDPAGPRPPRIGLVLVDHLPPEEVFADHPGVVGLLEGRHAVLRPYTTVEQIGQALELAGIGIPPSGFDPDDADDHAMARRVLQLTSGLAVQLNPFLARLKLIAEKTRRRPNATMVEAVLPYHRRMLELVEQLGDTADGRDYLTRVIGRPKRTRLWLKAGSTDAEHEAAAKRAAERAAARDGHDLESEDDADPTVRARPARKGTAARTRKEVLAGKRGEREHTGRVSRAIKRRGHVNP